MANKTKQKKRKKEKKKKERILIPILQYWH